MADIGLNGTTYSGTPLAPTNPYRPSKISDPITKIGRLLEAANGTPHWMHRAHKRAWTIEWEKAHVTTHNAVQALRLLTTTFPFVDQFGGSYTVLCTGEDEYNSATAFTDAANNIYYNLTLTVREG
jgi:hypothetical protein